jgi:short subunit dehydrogenase-like uncharacterized protein
LTATILLYGATGYSGRLIAAHAAARWRDRVDCRLVLAGRDGAEVARLAGEHKVGFRVFGLDRRREVERNLRDVDVLVNAAGPFAFTAQRLVKAALAQPHPPHYIDINGEIDVYKRLDDFALTAQQRRMALVCGAGYTAAASNVLLHAALAGLAPPDSAQQPPSPGAPEPRKSVGAVRIATSRIGTVSRGSVETLSRSVREQVAIVREGEGTHWNLDYVPAGMLERTIDFSVGDAPDAPARQRIASAANMIDTVAARATARGMRVGVASIVSFIETTRTGRLAFTASTLLAPLFAIPAFRAAATVPIAMLPEGPTADERRAEPHTVVLEIEDRLGAPLVQWRLQTPNAYDFTAVAVTAVAEGLAKDRVADFATAKRYAGWVTPGQVLCGEAASIRALRQLPVLEGCQLHGEEVTPLP